VAISAFNSLTWVSLSSSFAFNSSTSFEEDVGVEVLAAFGVVLELVPRELPDVETRFFGSATMPVGFTAGAERVVAVPFAVAAFIVVLGVAVFTGGFAGLDVVADVAGLRAAAAVPAGVEVLLGEFCVEDEEANDVRFVNGFFSSTELVEGADLCPIVLDEAGAAVLVAGFLTVEPAGGRVGGLLNPPVVVRATEAEDVLVADDAGTVLGRLTAIGARLGGMFSFLAVLGEASLSVLVSIPEVCPAVSASDGTSGSASS
jgi:hypothetical protein